MSVSGAPMVCDEHKVGVFIQSLFLQLVQEFTDFGISFFNGADIGRRHPFVGMACMVGMYRIKEDQGRIVLMGYQETEGLLVIGHISIFFQVANLIQIGRIVGIEQVSNCNRKLSYNEELLLSKPEKPMDNNLSHRKRLGESFSS